MPRNIFISYSHRDITAVKPIKAELERCGFSCWMDLDGIESGDKNFKRKIAPALDDCQAVLFFISEDSQKSEWTDKELGYAQRHGKRIVPLRFNDDPLVGEYDLDYGNANIIDWRVSEQREKLLRDLKIWSKQVEQPVESNCGPGSDAVTDFDGNCDENGAGGMSRKPSGRSDRKLVPRRGVCVIGALLALLGVMVCAGVSWYNEWYRRREAETLEAARRAEEERRKQEFQQLDAEKLAKLCVCIKVKVRDAKNNMDKISDFRADPVGFKEHLDNADEKWKYVDVVETNPATVVAAEALLKLVGESENVIANELEWLRANKGARDEAKSVEAEIARDIDQELERVEAGKYAKDTFLAGKRLRDEGRSALAQGDFLVAKKRLLVAKEKLSEAIVEAKSLWVSDMWQHLKEDVLSVRLKYEKHVAGNFFVADIPQRLFDLGEAHLILELMRGTNVVERIQNITLTQSEDNPDCRRAEMKCPARKTKGIDAYVLHILCHAWPIDLRFIPTVGVNIEDGKFDQKVTLLVRAAVFFMGECREHMEPAPLIQDDVIMAISNNLIHAERAGAEMHRCALGAALLGVGGVFFAQASTLVERRGGNEVVRAFKCPQPLLEVRTNGLLYVQTKARDYSIAYTNESPSKCRIAVSAAFLNPCGAQIFAVHDEKKLGAWGGGESILSMPLSLQGCELPSYVILKWSKK